MDTKKIADVLLKRFSVTPGRAEEIASEIALLFAKTEEIAMSPRPHVWKPGEIGLRIEPDFKKLEKFINTHSVLSIDFQPANGEYFEYWIVTYLTEKGGSEDGRQY